MTALAIKGCVRVLATCPRERRLAKTVCAAGWPRWKRGSHRRRECLAETCQRGFDVRYAGGGVGLRFACWDFRVEAGESSPVSNKGIGFDG